MSAVVALAADVNGDNGGDLLDLWIADQSGNSLVWPVYGVLVPWRSRITLCRAPNASDLDDHLAIVNEAIALDGSWNEWLAYPGIDTNRGLAGISGIKLIIGMQPYYHTAWARMRGHVALYRTDL